MVTLFQLINHVGNDFDVSKMEISALKTSLALDSKQIRRQRIRGITRRRSESNAREACRIIGGKSTSLWLRAMGFKNKEIECLMNWNRETLKGDFSLANNWFKDNREKVFCIGLWLEVKSEYSTTTPRRKKYYAKSSQSLPSTLTSTPRPNFHGLKIILWWDQKDLVYYELLKPGGSITSDRYRLQLIRLSRTLWEKRPEYEQKHDKVILHDNARPHVAKVVKKYLETLKWNVLPHPPYSPDIAPSDYGCSEGCKSSVYFFHRNQKLTPKLDRLQRVIFSRWNSKIAWEMGKSSSQRWTILWSVHSFCFEINAQKTDQTNLYSQ